jgi:hypothetical protein
MLIMIIFADVLVLYTISDKTVVFYIYIKQSQVPMHVLGMCKIPGIILRYIHILHGEISYTDVLWFCQLQDKTLLYYIHELHMCWVCVNFTTKLYCVLHVTSNTSFHTAMPFSVLTRTIEHVSVKLLQLHHDYTEKTVY